MIILDNNILVSLAIGDKDAETIKNFLSIMNLPIGIPTPVIAEFCAIDHNSRRQRLFAEHSGHEILVFDALCAFTCGSITEDIRSKKQSNAISLNSDKQKTKIDLQIVATAIVKKASLILSNDIDIKKIITALDLPIAVYNIQDLRTDIGVGPLFQ